FILSLSNAQLCPTPPPLPYTTLFRSVPDRHERYVALSHSPKVARACGDRSPARRPGRSARQGLRGTAAWRSGCRGEDPRTPSRRSEEHTSELQSREKHVCRLLLEKKN